MRKRKRDADLESTEHEAIDNDAEAAGSEFDSVISGTADGIEADELDADDTHDESEATAGKSKKGSRSSGWKRVFTGNKALWITSAVALVALGLGTVLGTYVLRPAASGDNVPDAGLITVPVEYQPLSNDVTIRADVGYDMPVDLKLDTSSFGATPIVTGRVPQVGDVVSRGDVLLEVVGRPIIVLPGQLPAYRTLKIGMNGPDVVQLRQALTDWGFDAGDLGSDVFDVALSEAIGAMYERIGYPAPAPEEGALEAYRAAEKSVSDAEMALNKAAADRDKAQAGPSDLESLRADKAVTDAENAWVAARDAGDQQGMADADLMIREAKDARYKLWNPDTSDLQAMVDNAWTTLEAEKERRDQAWIDIQPYMPAGEILYISDLPRRVDSVGVEIGQTVGSTSAVTISGAELTLAGSVPEADANYLKVGSRGVFDINGEPVGAEITELKAPGAGEQRWRLSMKPDEMTPEQYEAVKGTNVRVVIEVGATDGDVLSVPAAALTAGPGGETRVEVVDGDPRDGDRAATRLVVVETGLAAQGQVEVTPITGELKEGDLVVVG